MVRIICRYNVIMLMALLSAGCAPTGVKIMPVPADRSLEEIMLMRDRGWLLPKVAILDVDGVIVNQHRDGLFSPGEHPVSFLVEKLDAARKDPAVKAVILRINSPGGTVTASEIMHSEILRFRSTGKPVVAMFMDVAASGGYYIACACDEIMAHPTTVTGSIGVVMQTVDISGGLRKLGIDTLAIKSGPHKDAGSPLRPLGPEERDIFQSIINQMYGRFVEVVQQGRPQLNRDQVLEIADGRVFTAQQALELSLVDHIGTIRDAIDRAKELAGVSHCNVVLYRRPLSWRPNVYAHTPQSTPSAAQFNLINLDLPSWLLPGGAQPMYLWLPGQ